MTSWTAAPAVGARRPVSVWTAAAVALGAIALAGAILPFYAGPPIAMTVAAVLIGGLGIASAAAGLAPARRFGRPVSTADVFAAVTAALAVAVGVTAVLTQVASVTGEPRRPTLDPAQVLAREVEVSLGPFRYAGSDAGNLEAKLMVTMRNRLDRVRSFYLVIAAFDQGRHQMLGQGYGAMLAPKTTQTAAMPIQVSTASAAERLEASTFRIIDATSRPVP